jgi:hypothetical protein
LSRVYHDIGVSKARLMCIDCGKRPKVAAIYSTALDRCVECHNEHLRQCAAVHRAMS